MRGKKTSGHRRSLLQFGKLTTWDISVVIGRIILVLLFQEEERLSMQDFSHLLNNATFHTCLLACAVEVVLFTHDHMCACCLVASDVTFATKRTRRHCYVYFDAGMPGGPSMMAFPWILNVFELHGYEFYKVLESFIRAEPKLTREVVRVSSVLCIVAVAEFTRDLVNVRSFGTCILVCSQQHLQEVETKILESMAWQSGSPLYDVLNRTESVRLHMPPPSPRSAPTGSPSLEHSSAAQL